MISAVRGVVEGTRAEGRIHLRLGGTLAGLTLELFTTQSDALSLLPGDEAELFTHFYFSTQADTLRLFAFSTPDARALFSLLIGASGIGPSVALNLLELGSADLAHAIRSGDEKTLTKASGVGPKLAKKIILELGDKVAKEFSSLAGTARIARTVNAGGPRDEALDAIVSLGFPRQRAEQAVDSSIAEDASLDTVSLIRRSLAKLSAT